MIMKCKLHKEINPPLRGEGGYLVTCSIDVEACASVKMFASMTGIMKKNIAKGRTVM